MSAPGATVAVVSAGYPGKRRAYVRMAELGARLFIVDEPGHWSEWLVGEDVAAAWLSASVDGDPDRDAEAVLTALDQAGVRPDGVLTFWEDSVGVAARVAAELGLAGNPPEAVDAARSKLRTRELAAQLGLPTPRAQRVRSLDELFAAAADIGFPAVVKPEFGARAAGCIRVDDLESLPGVYTLVRRIVDPELDVIFRAGNDLLLEEYLDGVEFDVDLVMQDGECLFSSVSQNWPTAEPSFQETGLHCPPDHDRKEVRRLVRHLRPSRRPQAAAVNVIVYAPATGRLEALPIGKPAGYLSLEVDDEVPIGTEIQGPEAVFATALAEVTLVAKDLRTATALIAEVLRDPPRVAR